MTGRRKRRSDRFLEAVSGRPVTIVTHDNPDPDAIASGWALWVLLRKTRDQAARLIGRGAIVRAENQHMLRVLRPPLDLVDDIPDGQTAVVLVDCAPTASNHPLKGSSIWPVAVIDHHEPSQEGFRVAHRDIRPRAAATAGICAGYLREQSLEPEAELATALLYAIRTEITGPEARLTRTDRGIIAWLSGYADHGVLAEIEAAPLSHAYFSDLLLALENVFIYEDTAVCFLPQASGTEIVGEVADLLIRCEGVHRVLCGAAIGNDLIVSARTTSQGGDVLPLLRSTLNGFGNWGGHKHRGGGKIPCVSADGKARDLLLGTVKECWLAACEVDRQRGTRLVRKQAILEGVNR
jgi:nanoRNase/pAp phosphatase (c-di-AMP/oligoRNAs hydrolase)